MIVWILQLNVFFYDHERANSLFVWVWSRRPSAITHGAIATRCHHWRGFGDTHGMCHCIRPTSVRKTNLALSDAAREIWSECLNIWFHTAWRMDPFLVHKMHTVLLSACSWHTEERNYVPRVQLRDSQGRILICCLTLSTWVKCQFLSCDMP